MISTLNRHRRTLSWPCLVAAIAFAQVACDDKRVSPTMPTEPGGGNGGGAASVVISNVPTQALDFGDSVKLRADLKSPDGTSRDCTAEATWTASDPTAVDLVSGTLTVIGGSGPVTVKATCSGASGTATIPIDIRAHIMCVIGLWAVAYIMEATTTWPQETRASTY